MSAAASAGEKTVQGYLRKKRHKFNKWNQVRLTYNVRFASLDITPFRTEMVCVTRKHTFLVCCKN